MKLLLPSLLLIAWASGCCTEQVQLDAEKQSAANSVASGCAEAVRSARQKGEIVSIAVSGGVLVLDKGTDNGIGSSRVVTVCAVVVTKERTSLVPVATAEVVPSKTTSTLNLRTANVRDEDGDLVVREFRANPIRYAEAHQLVAVSGVVSNAGLVVPESERGTVIQSSIIKE